MFTIVGNTVWTVGSFDYETKSSHLLGIIATDADGESSSQGFAITVGNVNEVPLSVFLSSNSLSEDVPVGTVVASISSTDTDAGDTATYSLVGGVGATDNSKFKISGTNVIVAAPIDYETKHVYRIRVRATDPGGLWVENSFSFLISDVNEAPTNLALSNAAISENVASGTVIGTFSAIDPEGVSSITYSIPNNSGNLDNGYFRIIGSELRTNSPLDYETKSSYQIRVYAQDAGGAISIKVFTITVNNIAETFAAGDFGWAASFGSSGHEEVGAVTTDSVGNIYATGRFTDTVDFDPLAGTSTVTSAVGTSPFVAKYNSSGALLWARVLSASSQFSYGTGIAVDSARNVYSTGQYSETIDLNPSPSIFSNFTSPSGTAVYVSKLDSNGNFVWGRSMGGGGTAVGLDLDAAGNVHILGTFSGTRDFDPGSGTVNLNGGYKATFITKLNSSGSYIWAKCIVNAGSPYSIDVDAAGYVFSTGDFSSNVDFDPGPSPYTLITSGTRLAYAAKWDSAGNHLWTQAIGSGATSEGRAIQVDSSGNAYVSGTFTGTGDFNPGAGEAKLTSASNTTDVFLTKLNGSGSYIWAKKWGGTTSDRVSDMAIASNDEIFLAGTYTGGSAASNGYVTKYTATGSNAWTKIVGGPGAAFAASIALDSSRNIYFGGGFSGTADFNPGTTVSYLGSSGASDAFIAKFSQSYLSATGTVSNGYLVGATAFFDGNFNGVLDASEASAITNAQGAFTLDVPLSVDVNQNGLLDDEEGQWVVVGGTDSSTGLPAVDKLIAPGSWSVVTPLTTLVSTLARGSEMSIADATQRVSDALGLPPVDLKDLEPIAAATTGDANAAAVFAAHAKLQDLVSQSIAVLVGADNSLEPADVAAQLLATIGDLLAVPDLNFNLSDELVARAILYQAASGIGVVLNDELVAGAASVIAASNQAIDAVPVSADAAYLAQIAQVKIVSQGAVAPQLQAAAAGTGDIENVVVNNTGAALDAQISVAATPPTLIVPSDFFAEATSADGAIVTFAVSATNLTGESVPVALSLPSGYQFPLGATTVTATATIGGQTVVASFTITVVDTIGPELTVPQDIFIVSNAPGGANVVFDPPTAVDLVDPQPVVTFDAESGFFPLGETTVTYTAIDAAGNETIATFVIVVLPAESEVVWRHIFYNQSAWDGNNAAIDPTSDSAAIATSKQPYFAGAGLAVYDNITSFSRGINGIMIDLSAGVDHSAISAGDFVFKVGNNNSPSTWAAAPAPAAISVVPGGGVDGADRVIITWTSGSIANKWLQVQVLPTATTGLAAADVFFWGNKVGDSGTNPGAGTFDTTTADAAQVFSNLGGSKPIGDLRDYNRTKDVTTSDAALVFANLGSIVRLNLAAEGPFAPEAEPAVVDGDESDVGSGADDGWALASALAAGTGGSGEHALPGNLSTQVESSERDCGPIPQLLYQSDVLSIARKAVTNATLNQVTDAVVLDDALLEDLLTDGLLQELTS